MNTFHISSIPPQGRVHFIGIGGISMSGLAKILMSRGYRISGSDTTATHITQNLQDFGMAIHADGHDAAYAVGADLVVYTAAVKSDNPELVKAAELNIPAIERATLLGALMREYTHSICIAGTHGKTTTTSMMAHVLMTAELDPTITNGGELDLIGGNIRVGGSGHFLTEACEYNNSFLQFFPTIAVITNVEFDHPDVFADFDDFKRSFTKFANIPGANGTVVVCGDDNDALDCVHDTAATVITYGMAESNDIYPKKLQYKSGYGTYSIQVGDTNTAVELNVPGAHNVLNSLACFAAGLTLGIDAETISRGIHSFSGVHRRFEKRGSVNGALIIDDYAHHPTEIRCTLESARAIADGSVTIIFQPHTYTRTYALLDDFADALRSADKVIVTDIYAAREKDNGTVHAKDLAEKIAGLGCNASYISTFEDIAKKAAADAMPGDMIITMGAGTVTNIAGMITE